MIRIVCFSRKRPLQLHGYLTSMARLFDDPSLVDVKVLYRVDDEYERAYREVAGEFGAVEFVPERHFADDVSRMVRGQEYVCFGCDDVVFVRPVPIAAVLDGFDERVFAFSLRLGVNIRRSMFSGPTSQPPYLESQGGLLTWDLQVSHANGDFGYSWELNGTVYPADIVGQVVDEVRPGTPNLLEAGGGGRWSSKTARRLMRAFSTSRLVVPTVNVVQGDFANPIRGDVPLDPGFLLDCWRRGLRLDVDRLAAQEHDCIHVPSFPLYRL